MSELQDTFDPDDVETIDLHDDFESYHKGTAIIRQAASVKGWMPFEEVPENDWRFPAEELCQRQAIDDALALERLAEKVRWRTILEHVYIDGTPVPHFFQHLGKMKEWISYSSRRRRQPRQLIEQETASQDSTPCEEEHAPVPTVPDSWEARLLRYTEQRQQMLVGLR